MIKTLTLTACSLALAGCITPHFEEDFGAWGAPIYWKVSNTCPAWMHDEMPNIMEYSPVEATQVAEGENMLLSCEDRPPAEFHWEGTTIYVSGLARPTNRVGTLSGPNQEIVSCPLWLDPADYVWEDNYSIVITLGVQRHEVFHCFGVGHSNHTDSIMRTYKQRSAPSVSVHDLNELNRLYNKGSTNE